MPFVVDEILVGVVTCALPIFLVSLGESQLKAGDPSAAAVLSSELRNIDSVTAVLQRGLQSASQSVPVSLRLKQFLTSPEAEHIVRQIFGLVVQGDLKIGRASW